MTQRTREYVFTLNNYLPADREYLGRALEWCTFFCYQPELAPSTRTRHLQGYFCLTTPRTLRGVKQTVFGTERMRAVHLEAAKGSKDQCKAYCSKEESRDSEAGFGYTELGDFEAVPERRGQGARNDIHSAARAIADGAEISAIAQDFPDTFVKYHRGFTALQSALHAKPRVREPGGVFEPPRVYWFHGSTGTGKSHAVYEAVGDADLYVKPPGNSWFDGYRGQSTILLDDYRSSWFPFSYLLRLLDRYPLQVEVKGGYVQFRASVIYITCPKSPDVLYADLEVRSEGSLAQLLRRITEVRRFGDDADEPPAIAPMFVVPP